MDLKEKVAIVTGGSAGIGRAIAKKFAEAGALVTIFSRGKQAVEPLEGVSYKRVDVADRESVQKAVAEVCEAEGGVDILVNNAGITKDGLLLKMKEEEWNAVLDTNLKACFHTCQAVLRPMLRRKGGRIINITSVVGLVGNPGQANYAASKAGMIGFTKALAREVAKKQITVNCIAPGWIATKMTEQLGESWQEALVQQIPMARVGRAEEVAQAALFLASDFSSYITGEVLRVDGGVAM